MQSDATITCAERRRERHEYIQEYIGLGDVIDSFVIDRGHEDGPEIHSVTTTALILIQNARTQKPITELIARPEQLRRLYQTVGKQPPRKLLRLAYKHNSERLNNK